MALNKDVQGQSGLAADVTDQQQCGEHAGVTHFLFFVVV